MRSAARVWRESKKRYENLDKVGQVVSFSRINSPPEGFGDKQYAVVMVEFDKGKRVVGGLVDKMVKIGDQVKGVIRRVGKAEKSEVLEYGVKWKRL